ncbi:hypothetical protein 015DV002_127 [Bacillus phage 015DV002]|nr:hypothetical protein 000TH008_139 [Bacillus phage 000TH008]QQO40833.1 hypothetical protein 000TH009_139 [Bacillus phage 000TH009]QQO41081.1 hypothetical protein 015DV002_127 [Bacillus phage 015DV002]QQO41361.1 hypothetical protein 015DV004_146 [Bacillus phage 015DV004]
MSEHTSKSLMTIALLALVAFAIGRTGSLVPLWALFFLYYTVPDNEEE